MDGWNIRNRVWKFHLLLVYSKRFLKLASFQRLISLCLSRTIFPLVGDIFFSFFFDRIPTFSSEGKSFSLNEQVSSKVEAIDYFTSAFLCLLVVHLIFMNLTLILDSTNATNHATFSVSTRVKNLSLVPVLVGKIFRVSIFRYASPILGEKKRKRRFFLLGKITFHVSINASPRPRTRVIEGGKKRLLLPPRRKKKLSLVRQLQRSEKILAEKLFHP